MNILVISYLPFGACPLYRLIYPYTELNKEKDVEVKIVEVKEKETITIKREIISWADIIVMHSGLVYKALIDTIISTGKKLVVDIDDYPILPEYHVLSGDYKTNEILYATSKAHLVTTTTKFLGEQLRMRGGATNIAIVSNFIPDSSDRVDIPVPEKKTIDTLHIGYTGGICHENDIKMLQNFMQLLGKHFKEDEYKFHLFGHIKNSNVYKNYVGILTSNGKYMNNLILHNHVPIEEYYKIYDQINISLVPLHIDIFNKCKSNLKYLEAIKFNTIPICRDMSTYNEDIVNEVNGFLFSNQDGIIKALKIIKGNQTLFNLILANGKRQISENYTRDIVINNLKQKLYELL